MGRGRSLLLTLPGVADAGATKNLHGLARQRRPSNPAAPPPIRAIIFWNFPIFIIICCICENRFSIVFSSVTETPLPFAIRWRRRAERGRFG